MEIKNLSYKNKLEDINYTFTSKKIYGLIGNKENCRLLLELIRGLIKPSKGSIEGNERSFMLFSDSNDQIIDETVTAEILHGSDASNDDLKKILEKLCLNEDISEKDPIILSESEKKKVAFASMLASNPDVILIDNFFNKMDFKTKKMLIDLIKRLQFDEHKIIIIADQNSDLLYELVDEVIILSNEILMAGPKIEVFEKKGDISEIEFELPSYIEFVDYLSVNKGVKLPYRDRATDVVKDVYDNVK